MNGREQKWRLGYGARTTKRDPPGIDEGATPTERLETSRMPIRIGNQTNRHVPARLPYEFAVGHGFDAFEWFSIHLFPEHGAKAHAESLGPLLEAARSANVRLSLENTPETSPDHFNKVFGVLTAMPEAAGRVGMCLDSGHANLFAGTRNNFLLFVDLLGDHVPIIHWHAHENWGDRDSHLPLFTGPSARDDRGLRELVRRLMVRGISGSVVLEQWPQPPQVLVETRERLRRLLEVE